MFAHVSERRRRRSVLAYASHEQHLPDITGADRLRCQLFGAARSGAGATRQLQIGNLSSQQVVIYF